MPRTAQEWLLEYYLKFKERVKVGSFLWDILEDYHLLQEDCLAKHEEAIRLSNELGESEHSLALLRDEYEGFKNEMDHLLEKPVSKIKGSSHKEGYLHMSPGQSGPLSQLLGTGSGPNGISSGSGSESV